MENHQWKHYHKEIISFTFKKTPALATVVSVYQYSTKNMKIVYWD